MKVVFIGLGGIGSITAEKICRFLNYKNDNVWYITLVDGDEYEPKNMERQEFSTMGSKAEVKYNDLSKKFSSLVFSYVDEYVTKRNVAKIIPEDSIVILGVDNHKTRKVISEHVDTLNNCVVFSGGNDFIDGNVQIYIRKDGEKISPSLMDYHPEIQVPADKSPDEMSCEELHASEPQLYFVNLGAATLICWAFYLYLEGKIEGVAEIYFDMEMLQVSAAKRSVPEA